MITHVLFDLDGTLIDSLPGIEWSATMALEQCGITADLSDLRRRIGPPIIDILAAASGATGETLQRIEAAFRRCYDSDGWRMTTLRPGVMELLLRLRKAGRRLWLVTNKPSLATGRIVRELGIDTMFEQLLCRDSRLPPFSSKAEMLSELMIKNDIEASNSFMVGDTAEDSRAAAGVGLHCIIVPGGYGEDCSTVSGWPQILEFCGIE